MWNLSVKYNNVKLKNKNMVTQLQLLNLCVSVLFGSIKLIIIAVVIALALYGINYFDIF